MEVKKRQRQVRVLLKLVAADGKVERSKHTTVYLGEHEQFNLEAAIEAAVEGILVQAGEL